MKMSKGGEVQGQGSKVKLGEGGGSSDLEERQEDSDSEEDKESNSDLESKTKTKTIPYLEANRPAFVVFASGAKVQSGTKTRKLVPQPVLLRHRHLVEGGW